MNTSDDVFFIKLRKGRKNGLHNTTMGEPIVHVTALQTTSERMRIGRGKDLRHRPNVTDWTYNKETTTQGCQQRDEVAVAKYPPRRDDYMATKNPPEHKLPSVRRQATAREPTRQSIHKKGVITQSATKYPPETGDRSDTNVKASFRAATTATKHPPKGATAYKYPP